MYAWQENSSKLENVYRFDIDRSVFFNTENRQQAQHKNHWSTTKQRIEPALDKDNAQVLPAEELAMRTLSEPAVAGSI